ncbi:pilus assembly protein TadG-related protein [Thermomicrobium sp. CFH 73360]|uniref:pilus assembly protein TadG-related protein n=1 Tax=Thermomicrobium sp. CFH 73360 TaxID=2951987 RepID=UPI002076FEB4|nr:pilus assembly protein TadG-related protein [Thermomicrobium sp. CFH 73360]MCM8746483.1 pilus assembly protein TadG-related protein [Thermomicrobium sp. CFH 73360]
MRHQLPAQVLPLLALLLVPLLGFAALGTDAAYLYSQRRLTQNAVDAAALAGARELLKRTATDPQVTQVATTYATANGFPGPIPPDAISVQRPDTVRVRLDRSVPLFFLPVLGTDTLRVSARATARITQAPGEYALLALEDLITDPGIYANGTTDISVRGRGPSGRGASVRSNAAIDTRGTVTFIVDGCIDAAGTINQNGTWQYDCLNAELGDYVPDPLAGRVRPPSLNDVHYEYRRTCENYAGPLVCRPLPLCAETVVLGPGLYRNLELPRDLPRGQGGGPCTQARIIRFVRESTPTGSAPVALLDGTRLELGNTNTRLESQGVMLYVTGSGGIIDPKNGELHLKAPENAPYAGGLAGLAVWIANCSIFDSQGNGEFFVRGLFYAPCSRVTMHGNPYGTAVQGQVIVKDLIVRGTANFIVDYQKVTDTFRNTVVLVPNAPDSE